MYKQDRTTIHDRREMLRVKLKSLAAEARIIRQEERRSWGQLRDELHQHRILVVRREARATHLAYGLIRGLTLEQMEQTHTPAPHNMDHAPGGLWDRVRKMIKSYGPRGFAEPPCMAKPS